MEKASVFAYFEKLSGLSEDEGREYRFLCEAAIETVRLAAEQAESSRQQELAAAALAYYRYVLLSMTDGGTAVKVGEVSLRQGEERIRYAERLYKEAMANLKGYAGEEFAFERI